MTTYNTIATHTGCHEDEFVAARTLMRFGNTDFPGVRDAKMIYWKSMPAGETWQSLLDKGTICVGIGHGPFDEHGPNGERIENECSATLVAKHLGIDEDEALKQFFQFVLDRDSALGKNPYELPALIKTRYAAGQSDEAVEKWVFDILDDIFEQALVFYEKAGTDFGKAAVGEVRTQRGKVKFVLGMSDSKEFAKYARSRHGCKAGVVVQMTSDHHALVQTNNHLHMNLTDTVQILRIEELKAHGKAVPQNWKLLGQPGTIPQCPEWYLFDANGSHSIMNGSTTHAAPATKLSLERVGELVRIGVNPSAFEPSRATECKKEICSGKSCAWYGWGLHRCRRIRFKQHCGKERPAATSQAK
ncbi:MAG TPA: hypothetical protein VNG29_04425 [Candidatus Paceibacterota bacterium]|nr:hypothetical protein [Candidatus Paceibacterota bacterium]